MPDEVRAVTSMYEWLLWAVPPVNKLPRDYRFTLGDRIVNHGYETLELLLEASYTKDRRNLLRLRRANGRINTLRYLLRLAKNFKVLSLRRYEHGTRSLVDTGRQVGGWQRHGLQHRSSG